MGYFSELRGYYQVLGPLRFWVLMLGTVLFILLLAGVQMWLESRIGWPDSYGFHCSGRGCFYKNLVHSPKLLRGGGGYELALFAMLWWWLALIVGCGIYALLKRRLGKRRTRILPME